ncbi:transcription factor HES-5-like [Gastrophryne carolinensis]
MRRDRINQSIEQLRVLLEKDIQVHHQHSKLEKADILELAVNYLQRQKMHHVTDPQNTQDSYYHGYYMCLKETVGFLHTHGHKQGRILRHICRQQSQSAAEYHYPESSSPPREQRNVSKDNIWRPW